MESLHVLELYSGIGGMHQALKASGIPAKIVAAVDVNTVANEVYIHNFPATPLWPKTIEGISLKDFDRLSFDMILMSPPCQPFTRIGRQGDVSDPRTRSFLYILDILPRLAKLPKYLLLENVKGFETSSARDELIRTLEKCGFTYQEFLLSPTCLGIPNSRLRYFLIARLQSERFPFQDPGKILTDFPSQEPASSETSRFPAASAKHSAPKAAKDPDSGYDNDGRKRSQDVIFKLETAEQLERKQQVDSDLSVQMLKAYLQDDDEEMNQYLLPAKFLLRYAFLLDIVTPSCRRSTCFTKGYGHYIEGTGSVLQTAEDIQLESVFKSIEGLSEDEKLTKLSTLKLRYFTPREIANLQGFPPEFGFPDKVTTKQRYRLLGNSLNVHVVSKLISILVG
ncbi:tRNA (cytosine(38)-C(5))-methyltransferase-like isoform X2 [Podarcis raffonei]|uniref:tRNA (cytosine(38)-C(5))-methyltransferase-like isoform X2 n=1 Tax=Podarcis raffonei TaxID=65483 RepID=UPI002329218F|nr:tRNA (cytosine(38)-C(5))-methyltransferase-like isoform X2 [Podarcis raffonei]